MANRIQDFVVGYRWHCNRGNAADDECGELHGQEFYKNPEPGQRSVEEMPKLPLHFNCRCTLEGIYDYSVAMQKASSEDSKPSDTSSPTNIPRRGIDILGVNWIFLTPLYGNHGGKGHPEEKDKYGVPVDSMDALLKFTTTAMMIARKKVSFPLARQIVIGSYGIESMCYQMILLISNIEVGHSPKEISSII